MSVNYCRQPRAVFATIRGLRQVRPAFVIKSSTRGISAARRLRVWPITRQAGRDRPGKTHVHSEDLPNTWPILVIDARVRCASGPPFQAWAVSGGCPATPSSRWWACRRKICGDLFHCSMAGLHVALCWHARAADRCRAVELASDEEGVQASH